MSDSQNSTLFQNLCILLLQKLTLELKCPLCLKLLKNPVVFPCNHIFCKECIALSKQSRQNCPSCEFQCLHQEIRSAPYMESIVRLCQSLEETVNAKCSQPPSVGVISEQTPSPIDMGSNSRKEYQSEILRKRIYSDSQLDDSFNSTKGETSSKKLRAAVCEEVVMTPHCVIINDGEGVNTIIKKVTKKEFWEGDSVKSSNGGTESKKLRQSPDCVIIIDDEDVDTTIEEELQTDDCKVEGGNNNYVIIGDEDVDTTIKEELQTEDCKVEGGSSKFQDRDSHVLGNASNRKLVDNEPGVARADSNHMPAVHPVETVTWNTTKKPEKVGFSTNQSALESESPSKQGVHCSKSIKEQSHNVKSTEHRLGRHSRPSCSTANFNQSVCAFCHSSEQNNGTGRLLGFGDKKEIALTSVSKFDHSKVLIGHEKCVYWSPRVFLENDNIENLESEVARAAKLKCSSCGRKGAGLGCFLETCQKTYHVPCAYFTPEIRWDCVNYLMLCPSHISCQFPGELPNFQECSNEKSHPLPSEITSKQSDFRAMMPDGKNGLVLCGSALSAEDKGPKLFAGLSFYFFGDFEPDELNELIKLVEAAGGITETKEDMVASQVGAAPNSRYLVYNCNPPEGNPPGDVSFLRGRIKEAVDVAVDIRAGVLKHKWILDSIAGCKLAPFL